MKKKIVAMLCMLALAVCAFAGCGGGDAESAASTEFVIASNGALSAGLDPATEYDGWETMRWGIGETLYVLDDNMTPQPFLASDYDVSGDQLTWTFIIKDGITFHNGNPVDGNAVKGSIERLIANNERAATDLNIASVAADGQNVMITTNEPNASLVNSLCDPYACIVDASVDTSAYDSCPIGTGPYKVESYTVDDSLNLSRNDAYWNGTPKMETVVVRQIPDQSTLSAALQSGEINAAYGIPYSDLESFNSSEDFTVSQAATSRVFMLYYNLNDPVMKDVEVRKAIGMAIDKEALGSVVLAGAGTATQAAFPSYLPYGDDALMTNAMPFDVDGANAALEAAGYVDSDGDGIREKDGEKLSLKLVTYGRTGLPEQAEAVQSALNDIGMDVSYQQYDSIGEVLESGDYSVCVYAFVTTPVGDPVNYLTTTMGTDQGSNFGGYSNPEVDAKLKELTSEFDTEKRADLAIEIQQLALGDVAYCYLTHLNMALVCQSNVTGINQSPSDYYIITVDTGFAE